MLNATKDIQSLTTLRRRSGEFLKQLKKSKRPVALTVKGKAAAIVQDAEAYQRLLDIAAQADAEEGIRQGTRRHQRGQGQAGKGVLRRVRNSAWHTSLTSPPARSATLLISTTKLTPNIHNWSPTRF